MSLMAIEIEVSLRSQPVRLDPMLYQQPRWCANCGGEQTFVPVFEFEGGRVGFCLGCGEEKRVPFSHTTQEAA